MKNKTIDEFYERCRYYSQFHLSRKQQLLKVAKWFLKNHTLALDVIDAIVAVTVSVLNITAGIFKNVCGQAKLFNHACRLRDSQYIIYLKYSNVPNNDHSGDHYDATLTIQNNEHCDTCTKQHSIDTSKWIWSRGDQCFLRHIQITVFMSMWYTDKPTQSGNTQMSLVQQLVKFLLLTSIRKKKQKCEDIIWLYTFLQSASQGSR